MRTTIRTNLMPRCLLCMCLICMAILIAFSAGTAGAQSWTPVYNDGCDGEGHRVFVGEITTRATLGDGCDLVAGYVAPDQRYAGEWVWGYSPTAGAVTHASADDAAYFRPHMCDVLPRFPFARDARWETRTVQPREFLYSLYGTDYPAYIAASCRLREQNPDFAQIGLDRALTPGSRLAEPAPELVDAYNNGVLRRERVTLPVPNGQLTMVFPGDSLGVFAEIFDIPVSELQATNGMADANALLVGQLLLIPSRTAADPPSSEAVFAAMRAGPPARLFCSVAIVRSVWPFSVICPVAAG